ncbi:MAG: hypothetical protein HONBIEJF_00930 [Fimbriimonadaceae bacterium]|nr:hypothetical protein [Fimbriimonadaceae bacterium]
MNFDTLVTGFVPGGPAPWATLTIADVAADTVELTLTHNATSASGQFITSLLLNMDPVPGTITASNQTPINKFDGPFTYGTDSINDAGVLFDAKQGFETSNSGGGANRLKPGESVTFRLTGTGLNETDFLAKSPGTDILAMVHIQGIDGANSGKIAAVPEPATMVALASGLAIVARRRKRNA